MAKIRSALFGKLRSFISNDNGTTAVEYTIMASGVALALVATLALLSDRVRALYDSILAALS
ncbi:MAG: Flp family type IVb pilin [Pseudorhodoplanes sp.]|jgi:Flp pilus assembly pilin Flp|nr:Flp family type IVb pilin [Pseudorhodoplanes sp.]